MRIGIGLALALAAAAPAAAQTTDARAAKAVAVVAALQAGQPDDAIQASDALIAEYEKLYARPAGLLYCRNSDAAIAALYRDQASQRNQPLVEAEDQYCTALWAKGYALIELKQIEAAVPFLVRAVAFDPSNPHYLSELGYAYQALKQWPLSLETYLRAERGANLIADTGRKARQLGRALRGEGFSFIELQRWDEAKAAFEKAVGIDPDDSLSKGELEYIAQNAPKS